MSIDTYPPKSVALDVEKSSGGEKYAVVKDEDTSYAVRMVLDEMKIMNMHLAEITGEKIRKDDING